MEKVLKCPVCGKPLTETEYDQALGLWKEKQEHIKHLEEERKKLKEQEKLNQRKFEIEKKRLKAQELQYKKQAQQQADNFKKAEAKLRKDVQRKIAEQAKEAARQLKTQKSQLEKSFNQKMKFEIQRGISQGIAEQKASYLKKENELKKTKNKMTQLERSLQVSAKKYEQANDEIKKLKEQIQKGITPQIEGLLEEKTLLAKLEELFPQDKFEHPGKGGDIIQTVIEQEREIGTIVYECKKVKNFDKAHIEQAKEARRMRQADFAILITNAFPSKKQYYFVEKSVFVISPVSLEPITYTLRESLVRMALMKMSVDEKTKAVQKVYAYLSSNDYNNKINDVASQLNDLGKDLKTEMVSHRRTWEKRYDIYRKLFNDIGVIDHTLKNIVHSGGENRQKLLPDSQKSFIEIKELNP